MTVSDTPMQCHCVARYEGTEDKIEQGDYVAFPKVSTRVIDNSEILVDASVAFGYVYDPHEWQVSIRDVDNVMWVVQPSAIAKVKDK